MIDAIGSAGGPRPDLAGELQEKRFERLAT
jgi:hypothetical protein